MCNFENAGTTQGVDVALPCVWGEVLERVQIQLSTTLGPYVASVQPFRPHCPHSLIFANVGRFWDVGPELGPHWVCLGTFWYHIGLMLSHFWGICCFVLALEGKSWAGGILDCVWTFWATLAPYWAHVEPF